ncbi:MAG: FHA domain-containing protein [Planctomycetes bacterium]|nr:FHA domain-containing protein [Planctomycetota bacterium]
MAELIIKTGKQRGKTIQLSDSGIVIGRDEDCRIRLEAKGISRRHCSLKNSSNGWLIEDLGSRHGTFLNGERIEKELLLQSGAIFSVGPVEFQFVEKKTSPKKTTDDEIAGWLMEDDKSNTANSGAGEKRDSADDESGDKKFQSIAEEAADIIRRYQETSDRKQ